MAATVEIRGFRDLEEIGRGGFSTVYRGRQEGLSRTVALKVLHVDLRREPAAQRQFERECVLSAELSDHPHVLTVFRAEVTPEGTAYLASEYCSRGSLADELRRSGRLSLPRVLDFGAQVASALAAAHARGVLHRDVKPANILITEYGHAALADFGIAALAGVGALSVSQQALTAHHAPPELLETAREVPPSTAADVYALGSTLWTLTAGRPPFLVDAGTWLQFTHRVLSGALPQTVAPGVPDEVRELLAATMAVDPAARPTAAELQGRLLKLNERIGSASADDALLADHTVDRRRLGGPPSSGIDVDGPGTRGGSGTSPAEAAWRNGWTGAMPVDGMTSARQMQAPPEVAEPASAVEPARARRSIVLAAAALVVLALLVGAGLALLRGGTAGKPGAGIPSAPAASVDPGVPDAARARGVTVQRSGASAVLRWTNGTGYALLAVRQQPNGGPVSLKVITDPMATTTTLTQLAAGTRYCWSIVSVVEPGNPPVTTQTPDVCS